MRHLMLCVKIDADIPDHLADQVKEAIAGEVEFFLTDSLKHTPPFADHLPTDRIRLYTRKVEVFEKPIIRQPDDGGMNVG